MTNSKPTDFERLQDIGRSAYRAIEEMVEALNCDYERLEELRNEREDLVSMVESAEEHEEEDARAELAQWDEDSADELDTLKADAGDCASREDADQRIQEDPLSLQVRSDWVSPGEEMVAGEYEILLSTGGPATRIVGDLERGEPISARLEAQDWFQPWTEFADADEDILLSYARCFYFGS